MEEFRRTYLRLCKEGGVAPQESVVAQLQENRAAHSSRLDLSGKSLSVDTCSVLARSFQTDTIFTEVWLSDCMLSEEGAKVLLTGLFGNTTVKILDLKGNNLRSGGAEVLGKLLARNQSLRRLVLEWNALGVWDEAFSLFCEGLASNSMLTQLDLSNNQINQHGASELALALKHNTTLEVLDLRWNNIGLLGGRTLLEAFQKSKCVVQLKLAGNNIPSDTLKALEQTAGHNSDRQHTLRESHRKTQVLCKEIQTLKDKKSNQVTFSPMTEAALALSEQKNHNMKELLTRVKAEKEEQREQQSKERKKEQEVRLETQFSQSMSYCGEKTLLSSDRSKSQQNQIFELKQELTNSTAELKLRLSQTEDRLETEKRRSKQALEDMDSLRQKEVEHVNRNLEVSERALQERIFKLEGQRIQLEEFLSIIFLLLASSEQQERVSALEEKLRSVRSSLQEVQLHCSQQKQTISELQAKTSQQSIEMDGLRRRIEELQQELSGKDQEKVAEVSRVRVELQEQIGHLQAERTAQGGLKEKICALEREIKVLSSNHREALLDKESEMSSMLEKLRLKEAEIQRMRADEANRASYLQNAILTYVQGSPLGHYSSPKK
uniref:Leucine rich repeat containing 45 n=1 Tax=Scophthalmus maximus TaxID=52904 RepID=A0A8D3BLW2_SCOMX